MNPYRLQRLRTLHRRFDRGGDASRKTPFRQQPTGHRSRKGTLSHNAGAILSGKRFQRPDATAQLSCGELLETDPGTGLTPPPFVRVVGWAVAYKRTVCPLLPISNGNVTRDGRRDEEARKGLREEATLGLGLLPRGETGIGVSPTGIARTAGRMKALSY